MIKPEDFLNQNKKSRYDQIIGNLEKKNWHLDSIKHTVSEAVNNIKKAETRSFVIYGEPQCGKTEMMIALSGKLLDDGYKFIIILLNDSLDLLSQNNKRFQKSPLTPTSEVFTKQMMSSESNIGEIERIIFIKKNAQDLKKFNSIASNIKNKIIIDDEADYASPNSKINKGEKTKINELILKLLGDDGIYIGVTATPGRLDLNNTFENDNEKWVFFEPHPSYKGRDFFFPIKKNTENYNLNLLKDSSSNPKKELRDSLYRFLVNVAYLNQYVNKSDDKYIMLIHTSGKKADHTDDHKTIADVFNELQAANGTKYLKIIQEIINLASKNYPGKEREITSYIVNNAGNKNIVLMNSDTDKQVINFEGGTETPASIFTISIGGNIVSRGVTFNNLLTMFFTRDVKHQLQQDTYIQRARMFGDRGKYIKYFELSIPESLYDKWHRSFHFYRIAYTSMRSGNPTWLGDRSVKAVAPSSIDKSNVSIDKGLINFSKFQFNNAVKEINDNKNLKSFEKLEALQQLIGEDGLPKYFVNALKELSPENDYELGIHKYRSIMDYNSGGVDKKNITRKKGFFGRNDYNIFPKALHHIQIFYNDYNEGRLYYSLREGNIQFLRNLINKN